MRTSPRGHYIRENAVTRIPRNHLYLDSEAHREITRYGELQTFRLAVTARDRKAHDGTAWRQREWADHTDTGSVWSWVDANTEARARTVLVAHNLAYDLRITDAFRHLPAYGWRLKAIRLSDRQAWCSWRRDGRTLVMVDTTSWVPQSLETLGEYVEIPKLPLPEWDDSDDAWRQRCRRDVEILAEVWRRLLAWIRDRDLGNWKPTGAGQSWAAYRHRFMHHKLLVHEDDDARAAERHAAHTGRCEAWKHGTLTGGPFYEWDYETAYARIGAECDVPIGLHGELERPTVADVHRAACRTRVLVDATVTVDRPVVPRRSDDGIAWPVGRFRTTLWDNELGLVCTSGGTIDVHRAWWYRKAPALDRFCGYVLGGLSGCTGELDPVVRAALKHWSRALVGRMAAQWSTPREWGRADRPDVSLGRAFDASTGERFELMRIGTQLIRMSDTRENPDAMVAIMSWIMAEARVRLWRTMELVGLDDVAYVDTDSLIVGPVGHQRLLDARVPGLRIKSAWNSATILGPRQIVLQGRLRAAGIPRGAVPVDRDTWEGDVWQGLPASLRDRAADTVRIERRRFVLKGTDRRRRHLPDGSTAAFELDD